MSSSAMPSLAGMPEWSKGPDSSATVCFTLKFVNSGRLCLRGFEPHSQHVCILVFVRPRLVLRNLSFVG